MRKIRVNASKNYDILIGPGLMTDTGEVLKNTLMGAKKALIVSDDNVYPLYGRKVSDLLMSAGLETDSFVFPHGEQSKNIRTYGELLEYMCEARMTRSDVIAALGGGVAGDLAGFAAATYQRGIRFIQIPTSLLAAVDASVGGKTAIDLEHGKNLCGCFYQPSLVLCDIDSFSTLPEREYRCGCAEIIKYAMLESRDFLIELKEIPVSSHYEEVIARCVEIKSRYVNEDEFDTGKRMLLNLGHTFGHAIESSSNFTIFHGEAVAMGMAAITASAVKKGICDGESLDLLTDALKSCGLDTDVPYSVDELMNSALLDKKASGENIRIVLPETAGRCRTETISKSEMAEWMKDGGIR